MINAILIDDEINALEMLEWLIHTYCPQVKIITKCTSAQQGKEAIASHNPDIVFLDIEMPKMNGFDLLESITDKKFEVVFTTAYDQFAVRAFRFAALNYLLKPIDPDDLISTINRFEEKKNNPQKEQFELLFKNLLQKEKTIDRVALSTNDGLVFLQTAEIMYCKAESNYTHVVTQSGKKITVAKTLKEIDETLSGNDFHRVHNSYLVNINHVSKFIRNDGGYILMPDNTEISISRQKKDEFFKLFAKF